MAERQEPVRMCVVCRRRFAKSQLQRHVFAAGGTAGNGLEADESQVKPGRGWYLCEDPQCQARFTGMKFKRKSRKGSRNGKNQDQ